MKRRSVFTWILLIVVAGTIVWTLVHRASVKRQEYHGKISNLMTELSQHQRSGDELRRLLTERRYNGLTLRELSSSEWAVETPVEVGAKNWVLYVDLIASRIVTLRVRTADNVNEKPEGSPTDRRFRD